MEHNPTSKNPKSVKHYSKVFRIFMLGLKTLAWILCSGSLAYFFTKITQEYTAKQPITITTHIDAEDSEVPLKVKICNNNFLDPQKILAFEDDSIDRESYEFLVQAANGSFPFLYHNFPLPSLCLKFCQQSMTIE